jgi:hypothetical protein
MEISGFPAFPKRPIPSVDTSLLYVTNKDSRYHLKFSYAQNLLDSSLFWLYIIILFLDHTHISLMCVGRKDFAAAFEACPSI